MKFPILLCVTNIWQNTIIMMPWAENLALEKPEKMSHYHDFGFFPALIMMLFCNAFKYSVLLVILDQIH